jgi:hypothetical protein
MPFVLSGDFFPIEYFLPRFAVSMSGAISGRSDIKEALALAMDRLRRWGYWLSPIKRVKGPLWRIPPGREFMPTKLV